MVAFLLFSGACRRADGTSGHTDAPRNLLLLTLDTTRADHISCYGADPRITPNIDRLAAQGCRFVNAYSQTNTTVPSHVSMMTGLPALHHGVVNNGGRVREELDTLSQALRRAGRRTAAFVAVHHLGSLVGWRGFDTLQPVGTTLNAQEVTDRALAWLGRHGEEPFFLWVHYWDPHTPYRPPPEVGRVFYTGDPTGGDRPLLASHPWFRSNKDGRYQHREWLGDVRDPKFPAAMYAAEIHFADQHIGRLLADVDRRDWRSHTMIVLVGDHGESLGEHGILYSHYGLFEPELRVPFIIDLPGAPDGLAPSVRVTHLDIAPTIAEAFGIRLEHAVSGASLVPLLRADDGAAAWPDRRQIIHEANANRLVAVRRGRWKLICPIPDQDTPAAVRAVGATDRAAGVWPIETEDQAALVEPVLFDIEADPEETTDLAGQQPEMVRSLLESAAPWIQTGTLRGRDLDRLGHDEIEHLRDLGYLDTD